ncbi:MAG: hypothetical protein A2927_02120 [Candidatus Komeilibacteria bacterium RIFCSPLOWO2_01_FULL_45_10]|uniref:Glycoside hydrolase family 42 N-terminal domain-containing protein n=1 Tax=Candidatus Komeilibacteria bacterium RIFCSPLOWO2_01_FULL_45_10 TaxID=1798550 RepID=A0A1G2BMA1_9BACT|nr:MAG: hypothetical protein A2927_02120 [Candidatus Komeilibacteria bacterium RIFCSPLOWO2_01_FULL_45_10]
MSKRYFRKIIIWALAVFLAGVVIWLYRADFGQGRKIEFGVTFSQKYATELKLDWQKVFISFLDDLQVKKFRLVAYWDLIEKEEGNYDFSALDFQLGEIEKRGGQVILAIGQRVPRWPECHWPDWTRNQSEPQRQARLLNLMQAAVEHFKRHQSIAAWQVENEPFLKVFGQCPKIDKDFYQREIDLVKSLDGRPVVVTESGELSGWLRGAVFGDWLGTSLYRITWNQFFGYFSYPLPPAHYYLKSRLVGWLAGNRQIFISEMQAEPWLGRPMTETPLAEQYHSMNLEKFRKNIEYASQTGLSPIYLWGAEWWYWLKEQGNDSIWQAAKEIWN